jgi:hypothetical protein
MRKGFMPTEFAMVYGGNVDVLTKDAENGNTDARGVINAIAEFWQTAPDAKCLECSVRVSVKKDHIGAQVVLYDREKYAVAVFCKHCAARYETVEEFEDATYDHFRRSRLCEVARTGRSRMSNNVKGHPMLKTDMSPRELLEEADRLAELAGVKIFRAESLVAKGSALSGEAKELLAEAAMLMEQAQARMAQ